MSSYHHFLNEAETRAKGVCEAKLPKEQEHWAILCAALVAIAYAAMATAAGLLDVGKALGGVREQIRWIDGCHYRPSLRPKQDINVTMPEIDAGRLGYAIGKGIGQYLFWVAVMVLIAVIAIAAAI